MKSAMFILGLLVGGNHGDGLVTVVDPIQPVQPVIQVSAVFDEPVPADIQLLETTEYGWVGCEMFRARSNMTYATLPRTWFPTHLIVRSPRRIITSGRITGRTSGRCNRMR
jgi:hypothetical protein